MQGAVAPNPRGWPALSSLNPREHGPRRHPTTLHDTVLRTCRGNEKREGIVRVSGFVVLMALVGPARVTAQEQVARLAVLEPPSGFLYGTLAAVTRGSEVAILTPPAPAVHVFAGPRVSEWGEEGKGPGELGDPVDIAWRDGFVVLDRERRRIVAFDENGNYERDRRLNLWTNRIHLVGSDTIVGTFEPMSGRKAVVRIRGNTVDTLLSYASRGEQIRLTASGAPSLTLAPPFTSQDQWSVLPNGSLVWFDAATNDLRLRGLQSGSGVVVLPVTWEGLRVSSVDKDEWLATAIPADFKGQRVFEPLRAVARREVRFPDQLPPVLALEPDPVGGVWVKRRPAASGEIWRLVGTDGATTGEIALPEGRKLLAVGATAFFALARDEFDVETVETYARPGWAG